MQNRGAFWDMIKTNNLSREDSENVKRYEDERSALITTKIIQLGICIALAWERNKTTTESGRD